jgi:hypothetical protein
LSASRPIGHRAAGLLQVVDDDVDLDPDRRSNSSRSTSLSGATPRGDRAPPGRGSPGRDEPALDDFGEAADQLVARQGLQGREVADHAPGLVEGADEVLALAGVHARLAADCGVDHPEQRGRQVHDLDAT